ncbi:hypothetical protein PG993_009845 [Apiospora rasikravindrae]|uniref:Uncharacterized protein n=1 Tax=Apiospora rasikravindrae TaxID=990691 RepID=A0ABR1SMB4_9PEZI
MVAASVALAGNSVVLSCIGNQIRDLALLHSLCLVNRQFNVEFSPFLYRYVKINNDQGLHSLAESTGCLRYTKEISFSGPLTGSKANDVFREILLSIARLEAFNWIEVPLATRTIHALQAAPNHIRKLHIEYVEDATWNLLGLAVGPEEEDENNKEASVENRRLYRAQDLSGFSNLTELTVHNIHDDIPRWRRRLATALARSPGLRALSLSLAVDAVARAAHRGRHEDYWGFFEELARDYAEEGGAPLPLRTLHCGTGVFPTEESRLRQLVDLSGLEQVHVQNVDVARDAVYMELYDDDEGTPGYNDSKSSILFGVFLDPAACPRLRRFTACALMPDVWEALCAIDDREFARQLAVSFRRQEVGGLELARLLLPHRRKAAKNNNDTGRDKVTSYPRLPMPLRMVDLELCRDTGSGGDLSVETVLEGLVDSCSESLEGLTVRLPGFPETARLAEVLVPLMDALAHLSSLTQLAVKTERRYSASPAGFATVVAEELAASAPHLRYIGVDDKFWQVSRVNNSSNGPGCIQLREMDKREQDCIELFTHTIFAPDP